jgi:hypothetical protein
MPVSVGYARTPWHVRMTGLAGRAKPVPYNPDCHTPIVVVCSDILSSNVGAELLIAVWRSVENQAALAVLFPVAEAFGPKKYTQLQGHVEARQSRDPVQGRAREIMDTVPALSDDPVDLVQPDHAAVVTLQRTASDEPAIMNRKNQRLEQCSIAPVEWNVEEHLIAVSWRGHRALDQRWFLPAGLIDVAAEDFLADFLAVFFAERLALFLADFPCQSTGFSGSAVAGPNRNLKYDERWCPSEPPGELRFTVLATRAAPRALLREMVPVFAAPMIGRCSIGGL